MNTSKTITSVFMVVALVVMAALAISVNQKSETNEDDVAEFKALPGLAENLRSMAKITEFPASHIRSVRITRTNGNEVAVIREQPDSREFQFETPPAESVTAYSAILYANAAFLDALRSSNAFAVTGFDEERVIGQLTYTTFDGLVLKSVVFRAQDATWLRMIATHSPKLEARYTEATDADLLSADEIIEIARKLDGRVYRKPDE
jgi:hypothetical protein